MKKDDLLKDIAEELEQARDAPLFEYRQTNNFKVVPGQGNADAQIMFVGEAPGYNEARQGRPFVGAAGKLLDELLGFIHLHRETVFITNIVKDRPPENRNPRKEEIEFYAPFLDHQIEIIRPEIIVTLGRFAMEYILEKFNVLEPNAKISQLHGQVIDAKAKDRMIKLLPLYHPAAALYDDSKRNILFEDFKVLGNLASLDSPIKQ